VGSEVDRGIGGGEGGAPGPLEKRTAWRRRVRRTGRRGSSFKAAEVVSLMRITVPDGDNEALAGVFEEAATR
jgi:hypothetical protein